MLKPKNSRLLAKKMQIAIYNRDFKMMEKIQSIKYDNEITEDIINYKIVAFDKLK